MLSAVCHENLVILCEVVKLEAAFPVIFFLFCFNCLIIVFNLIQTYLFALRPASLKNMAFSGMYL